MKKRSVVSVIYVVLLLIVSLSLSSFGTSVYSKLQNQNDSKVSADQSSLEEKMIPKHNSIADIIEALSPGVVTVSVNSIVDSYNTTNQVSGIGSGFFITPTRILTNQHVVLNASTVNIILYNGQRLDAKVINTDVTNDIALLEVTTPGFTSSTVLQFGSSDNIRVGEWVIAIGSPLDLSFSGSSTVGIISGLSRKVETKNGISTFIQTDAAINPGNSGGPLLNLRGEVIGINTAKISVDGVEGIGLSIPISIAKLKLEELSTPVITLGLSGVNITDQLPFKVGVSSGIFVVEVERGSLSDRLGIMPGDSVVEFNGTKIFSIDQINELKKTIQDTLNVLVVRNNKQIRLQLKINE